MDDYIELENCRILKVTNRAVLIWYEQEQFWIPKSQIEDPASLEEGEEVDITVTEWIAKQNGIA